MNQIKKQNRKITLPHSVRNDWDSLSMALGELAIVPHIWKGLIRQAPLAVEDRILGDFEMIYLSRGKARISLSGQDCYLNEGEILLIPPYLKHSLYSVDMEPLDNYFIHFNILPPYRQGWFNHVWSCE